MNCIINSWTHYEAELRGYLTKQTRGDRQLAEDLLQNVFVKAIAQGKNFCDINNTRAWLYKVARNQLIDAFRKEKHFEELDELDDEQPHVVQEIPAVESLSACLPRALQQLGEQDREVISLCDIDGLNQAEYAVKKNISLPGAKSRIQRARQRLKQQLHTLCEVKYDEAGNVCCHESCQAEKIESPEKPKNSN